MAVHHCAEHHVFRQDLRFGFHHQNGFCRTGHHQIQLGFFQLGLGRVQQICAVCIADACRTDGAGKRYAAQYQCGGRADHGGNVGIDFGIKRNHHGYDLNVVIEAFGEQRTDGAVDQAAGEDFFLALFALTLEKTAGDFTCGIGALKIIDGQREEVLPCFYFFVGGNGHQDNGVAHGHFNRCSSLAGDFACFQRNGMFAVLEGFDMFIEHVKSFRFKPQS